MHEYTINVVASFGPDPDVVTILGDRQRAGFDFRAETSALDIVIYESVMVPLKLQTVTFTYEVEGQDVEQARRFAIAIYRQDAEKIGLPEPETLIANPGDDAS